MMPIGPGGRLQGSMHVDSDPPTQDDLRRLHAAAARFAELAPWHWMENDELFGVGDPASGIVGYGCVMGALGEVFGIAVYPGDHGYDRYRSIMTGALEPGNFEAGISQDCLLASFEDRDALDTRDRAAISDLGLRFRGRNAWPLFRSYRPGYAPWYLEGWEARLLTVALEQAVEVCGRVLAGLDILEREADGLILVRRQNQADGWADSWEPTPAPPQPPVPPALETARLQRMSSMAPSGGGIWEVGLMYLPGAVAERGRRPYYPRTWLCVEKDSGFVSGVELMEPQSSDAELQEAFLVGLERAGVRPAELRVAQAAAAHLLQPVAVGLDIRIRRVRRLPAFEDAKESLMAYLQR